MIPRASGSSPPTAAERTSSRTSRRSKDAASRRSRRTRKSPSMSRPVPKAIRPSTSSRSRKAREAEKKSPGILAFFIAVRRSLDRSEALLYPQPGGSLVGQGPAEIGRITGRAFRGFEERRQSGKRLALGKLLRAAQAGHGEPGLPLVPARHRKSAGLDQIVPAFLAVNGHVILPCAGITVAQYGSSRGADRGSASRQARTAARRMDFLKRFEDGPMDKRKTW